MTPNDSSDQTKPTKGYLSGIFGCITVRKTPKRIEIEQHLTPEQIRRLYKKEKDKNKAIRLLIIYHLMKGKTPKELAELLQLDESTIYRLIKRWNKHGLAGLENSKKGAENQQ